MPFEVTYDDQADCLVARLSGDLDTKLVGAFFAALIRAAEEHGCTRALSDLRDATIRATAADLYWMAESLARKNIRALQRRAIVVSRDQEDYSFWETVCANQGVGNVRIFEDYDEARRWAVETA